MIPFETMQSLVSLYSSVVGKEEASPSPAPSDSLRYSTIERRYGALQWWKRLRGSKQAVIVARMVQCQRGESTPTMAIAVATATPSATATSVATAMSNVTPYGAVREIIQIMFETWVSGYRRTRPSAGHGDIGLSGA